LFVLLKKLKSPYGEFSGTGANLEVLILVLYFWIAYSKLEGDLFGWFLLDLGESKGTGISYLLNSTLLTSSRSYL
jgi:hypothetical protein